jgi:hypothetical protein
MARLTVLASRWDGGGDVRAGARAALTSRGPGHHCHHRKVATREVFAIRRHRVREGRRRALRTRRATAWWSTAQRGGRTEAMLVKIGAAPPAARARH